jgi:excinuclease ABC subunit C
VCVCSGAVTPEDYRSIITEAEALLEGKAGGLTRALQAEMLRASEELEYEKAALLRDKLGAINALMRRQIVVGGGMADTDAVGCFVGEAKSGVAVMHYKDGDLISKDVELFDHLGSPGELISSFLVQYYPQRRRAPREILLSARPESAESIAAYIQDKTGTKTRIFTPERGKKRALAEFAEDNAREEVLLATTKEEKTRKLLLRLQSLLGLDSPPVRIEAVDISNTGQSERVGAMTCYFDGRPLKKAYRHYIIHGEDINDDYHAMEEVLARRFRAGGEGGAKQEEPPDILLVDGGATHAAMAARVLGQQGFNIPVFGIVKNEKHRTKALVTPENEEIGLTGFPAGFAFIAGIQEETHRCALQFHQKRRSKFTSALDNIPGVGEARKQALIARYKSVKKIAEASPEELAELVPINVARAIAVHLNTRA